MSHMVQSHAIKWLEAHGLSQHEEILRKHECLDLDAILELTEEDLKNDLALSLGSRKIFFKAIKSSQTSQGNQSSRHGMLPCIFYAKAKQLAKKNVPSGSRVEMYHNLACVNLLEFDPYELAPFPIK